MPTAKERILAALPPFIIVSCGTRTLKSSSISGFVKIRAFYGYWVKLASIPWTKDSRLTIIVLEHCHIAIYLY